MFTKKHITLTISLMIVIFGAPFFAYALGPQAISNTSHNLAYSTSPPGQFSAASPAAGGTDEVCVFCHTPHNSTGRLPLWNRYTEIAAMRMYTSSVTLTTAAKNNTGLTADSSSRLCLSCHDGLSAINAVFSLDPDPVLVGGDIAFEDTGAYGSVIGGTNFGPSLGTNLTNMHPINFSYSLAQAEDSELKTQASVETAGLKFYGANNTLECATCHDPHVDFGWAGGAPTGTGDLAYKPFLRKPNTSSSLCLTCHIK